MRALKTPDAFSFCYSEYREESEYTHFKFPACYEGSKVTLRIAERNDNKEKRVSKLR